MSELKIRRGDAVAASRSSLMAETQMGDMLAPAENPSRPP